MVRISVTDDGPGIDESDREKVFDRFTRLDDARDRETGGTGLGLAIVRELIRRAGGAVAFRDPDGPTGITAEIRLPDCRVGSWWAGHLFVVPLEVPPIGRGPISRTPE